MARTKFTGGQTREDGRGREKKSVRERRRWTIAPRGSQGRAESRLRSGQRPVGKTWMISDPKALWDSRTHPYLEKDAVHLGEFTKLALPAYREPTIEFLASLKLKLHPQESAAELKRDGAGYITFKLLGQDYLLSMLELETIYQFEEDRGLDTEVCVPATELHALWKIISSRTYQISKNKSGNIKNLGIRYAHKVIANTIFARHDCSNVTTQELELLDAGIIQNWKPWTTEKKCKGI
ncbi:unnamed protein product [Microthlaspi erraticum]|uniref:Arabidopsis retrotransposon Orf1 C-terminal domain-containing protein n=1 Tax=Microthlaspi erraticum TaxID=1685480 RepID=A0A6D2HMM9_9BRAS|nr:unnamed protein product [Microthlaspi erraticum]